MKINQAQIMRKALEELATGIKHREVMVRIAKNAIAAADAAALTAAAEVGELTESRLKASEDLRTGLVEEIHRQHKEIERLKIQVIERDSAIAGWIKREAATIERCAQVAENHPAYAGKMIAADMRALKDTKE